MWREAGRHCGGCVCVWCWGRQSLAVLSHLSKLATSTAHQSNNKKRGRADQKHQTKTKQQTQQGQQKAKTKGQQTTNQNTQRQRSGQRKPTNEQGRGGRQQAEASSSRTKRAPGKAARTGGRKQHRPRRRAHAALAASWGGSGSPKGEYLSAGRKSTETALATWCRGRSPTQGRSLCCHEEKWRKVPSRHNTPCHRHDNRAVANTTRYPEGGTSRVLTGGGQSRGGTKKGESEPSWNNPTHQKQSRTKQPRKKTTAKTKGQQKPATPQTKTKQKTQGPRDTGHTGTTRAGRSKQAAHYRSQHTTQRKTTDKEQTKKTRGQTVNRQTGGQTKHETEQKRIKEYECTCPVCGQTHKYNRGQDQFMRRENRNKCTNVPVQFAGMHAGMHAVQKGSRPQCYRGRNRKEKGAGHGISNGNRSIAPLGHSSLKNSKTMCSLAPKNWFQNDIESQIRRVSPPSMQIKLRKECFYIYFSPLGFAQALHCNQKASHAVLGTQNAAPVRTAVCPNASSKY